MKLKKILLAVATTLPMVCAPAYAGLQVDDWTLDTSTLAAETGGTGNIVVNNIDEILFTAVTHATSSGFFPGATFSTSGLGVATQFNSLETGIIAAAGLNSTWELTFDWTAGGTYTTIIPPFPGFGGAAFFTHSGAGAINFYIDDITGGVGKSNPTSGAGYVDGTKIATFSLLSGEGGVLFLGTSDGSDDSNWLIDIANSLAGVIFDNVGNDLGTNVATGLHTDSNFDAAPVQGTAPFSYVAGGFACGQVATDFCSKEDGSAVLTVPEPASLALLGLGLAGMGLFGRRSTKKA